MKKTLVQKLGLLGILSFLSYAAAVIFSPLAYPGYDPLSQAVSDLSAASAPSLSLWNRLSAGYNVCEVVTALVVLLSIVSLSLIIVAGAKDRGCRSYGVCAAFALCLMLVGAAGVKMVPAAYFGVVERFSVFAATGFNAALGIHLFLTTPEKTGGPAGEAESPS